MEEKPIKQAIRYLMQSNNILLVTHEKMDGDGLGSGIALYLALSKLNKNINFISLDDVPQALTFLPKTEVVSKDIPVGNDFVITVNCTQAEVDKIKYNKIGAKLNILISPKRGVFTKEDVEFKRGQSKYDLIISLDAGDINQLGKLYKENVDLFYGTVLLNIDHHISNDYFGKINLVDPTATSTSEIVLSLLDGIQSAIGKDVVLMDGDIATCLLTGITVDTNSFQNQNTSPKAFSVAAQLLGYGARQQEIIKNIYKTHHLSTLKLWGRALSNIKYDEQARIVWSGLTQADFLDSEASEDEVHGVIDELITSAPGAEIAILFSEMSPGNFKASLRTMNNSIDANELAMFFQGGGHKRAAGFKISGDDLQIVENTVIKKLYDYQYKRLNEGLQTKSVELEEDKAVPVPNDPVTQEFISKLKEASKLQPSYNSKETETNEQKNVEKEENNQEKSENKAVETVTPKVEIQELDKLNSVDDIVVNEKKIIQELEDLSDVKEEDSAKNFSTPIVIETDLKEKKEDLKEEISQEISVQPENVQVDQLGEQQIVVNHQVNDPKGEQVDLSEKKEENTAGGFSLNREVIMNTEPVIEKKEEVNSNEKKEENNVGGFSLNREVVMNTEPVIEKEMQPEQINPIQITGQSADVLQNSTPEMNSNNQDNQSSFTEGLNLKLK